MSVVRGIVGAALGAAVAGVALRVRTAAKERDQSLGEVIADLPGIVGEDVTRISDAARHAYDDGRAAAQDARIHFDEQVQRRARRTKGHDV